MNKKTVKAVRFHGNGNNSEGTNAALKGSKHDANLRKRGFLRFQVGLILAMLLVYLGLEASFMHIEPKKMVEPDISEVSFEYYPEMNDFKIEKPREQQQRIKKVKNPTFEIVPDDNPTKGLEEFLEKQEEPDNNGDLDPNKIVYEEPPVDPIVPWVAIEDAPIFPGCEKVAKSDRKTCFQEKIQKHIKRNFRYPEAEQDLGIQGRVSVIFKINVDGSIIDVQMRGPNKNLEKEAARIIGKLPQMTPGKQRGTPVKVPFSIPINFRLNQ